MKQISIFDDELALVIESVNIRLGALIADLEFIKAKSRSAFLDSDIEQWAEMEFSRMRDIDNLRSALRRLEVV